MYFVVNFYFKLLLNSYNSHHSTRFYIQLLHCTHCLVLLYCNWRCRPCGCTVASGVVGVVVVVVVGVCNRFQMITSKPTCSIFGVSVGLDLG